MSDALGAVESDTETTERSVETVVHTIGDVNCRAILRSVAETPMTANEIAEEHDLSLSSAYRKLGDLTDIGLLNERPRINAGGGHASEYYRDVDRITLDFDRQQVRYTSDPTTRDAWEERSPAELRTAIAEQDGGNEVLRLVVGLLFMRGLPPEEIATWLWLPSNQVVSWLEDPPEKR